MARVNVEQKALTDPRFRLLGLDLGAPPEHAQAVGLFFAIQVWSYAQERGTDALPGYFVEAIHAGLLPAMVGADLLAVVDTETVRVKGWEASDGGWLERQRATSRAGGMARAAGAKRGPGGTFLPAGSSRPPAGLDQPSPAVASALTPAPALSDASSESFPSGLPPAEISLLPGSQANAGEFALVPGNGAPERRKRPRPGDVEREKQLGRWFEQFYGEYPRHIQREDAWKAFRKLNPSVTTMQAIWADLHQRLTDGTWNKFDQKHIPYPASYLNKRSWK